MKVADYRLLNIGPTPKEIKRMRKEIYDYHYALGRPVIFKHRWNMQDVKDGLCDPCPYLDQTYHRNKTDCAYCFGTGFLGGFADGVVTFVTIADAPVDTLKISPEGYILYDRHPQLVAPWTPEMGDGDLIITAEFDRANWSVLKTLDVFEVNKVDPTTIRGIWGQFTDYKLYKVQQNAQIDRVPNNHVYYNVPIEFDYTTQISVVPPVGAFPSDYPRNRVAIDFGLRMNGKEAGMKSSISQNIKIDGDGVASSIQNTIKITGRVGNNQSRVIFE